MATPEPSPGSSTDVAVATTIRPTIPAASWRSRERDGEESFEKPYPEVLGFEETEDGLRIRSHGCPLSNLVRQDPEACLLAEALVETISGVEVRETCDRSDRPRCRFEPRRND